MDEENSGFEFSDDATALRFVAVDEIVEQMRDAFDAICQRAHQIFEANGSEFGRDQEDWFRAEDELLHTIPTEIFEVNDSLIVRADVAGFQAKELAVSLEPRRVLISGECRVEAMNESGEEGPEETRPYFIFRALDLPVEVDPNRVTATLSTGVLKLEIHKAARAVPAVVESSAPGKTQAA